MTAAFEPTVGAVNPVDKLVGNLMLDVLQAALQQAGAGLQTQDAISQLRDLLNGSQEQAASQLNGSDSSNGLEGPDGPQGPSGTESAQGPQEPGAQGGLKGILGMLMQLLNLLLPLLMQQAQEGQAAQGNQGDEGDDWGGFPAQSQNIGNRLPNSSLNSLGDFLSSLGDSMHQSNQLVANTFGFKLN